MKVVLPTPHIAERDHHVITIRQEWIDSWLITNTVELKDVIETNRYRKVAFTNPLKMIDTVVYDKARTFRIWTIRECSARVLQFHNIYWSPIAL